MNNRIFIYDIVRSLCVLWIVAFWHMLDYFKLTKEFSEYGFITIGVLSCFTFLSGLFLGKKCIDMKTFYVIRFKRFWILLFLSSVSFYIIGYIKSSSEFIGTITGLSCLGLPWARTLWYFGMLIFFYLLTPFLLDADNNKRKVLVKGVLIFMVILLISYITPLKKSLVRVIPYYPYYLLGILTPLNIVDKIKQSQRTIFVLFFIAISLLCFAKYVCFGSIHVMALSVFIFIFLISIIIEKLQLKLIRKTVSYVAFSSMCAYLFHRQIYGVIAKTSIYLLGCIHFWEIPIMLGSLFIISYYIQKYYNIIIKLI